MAHTFWTALVADIQLSSPLCKSVIFSWLFSSKVPLRAKWSFLTLLKDMIGWNIRLDRFARSKYWLVPIYCIFDQRSPYCSPFKATWRSHCRATIELDFYGCLTYICFTSHNRQTTVSFCLLLCGARLRQIKQISVAVRSLFPIRHLEQTCVVGPPYAQHDEKIYDRPIVFYKVVTIVDSPWVYWSSLTLLTIGVPQ